MTDEKAIDYLSLHLAFYLASWGMYRGSSFLLQKDYKVHMPVVRIIMKEKYNTLFGISAEGLLEESNLKLLDELSGKIRGVCGRQHFILTEHEEYSIIKRSMQKGDKKQTMIKSMTGFGRCEVTEGSRKFTVEMKSVNHRYLDVNMKMPKKLNFFESAIRNELKNYIQRGKVDLFITYEDFSENNVCIRYNRELAGEYMQYLQQMSEEFGLDNDVRVSALSRFPEVFTMEEQGVDEEELWKELQRALKGAAEGFVETRIREGENLKNDLLLKLDGMLAHVDYISERSPQIITEYKKKLREKVEELLEDTKVDEGRLLMEVTIFADKVCVDEEIVRLRSHIEATKKTLTEGGSIGRKLDFIAQEMNREANTILSKANDLEISNRAIELKTEIEKVREQIQNIE